MAKDPKLHNGHFERIRMKILETDVEKLSDTEVLEMMLQYTLRRADVNEIAKRILHRFGSFDEFCRNADVQNLLEIEGIGPSIADKLLCLCRLFCFARVHCDQNLDGESASNSKEIARLMKAILGDDDKEITVLFILDKMQTVVHFQIIGKEAIDTEAFDLNQIVPLTKLHGGMGIVIAQNHVNGVCMPTESEIEMLGRVMEVAKRKGLTVFDYVIISSNGIYSFKDSNALIKIEHRAIEKIRGRRIFGD